MPMSFMGHNRWLIEEGHGRQEKARREGQNRKSVRTAPEKAHDIVIDLGTIGYGDETEVSLVLCREGKPTVPYLVLPQQRRRDSLE